MKGNGALARLDRELGRMTMYRLVFAVLVLLALYALAVELIGELSGSTQLGFTGWTFLDMVASLAVVLVATVAGTWLGALLLRVRPYRESALITGLILWFLFWPGTTAALLVPIGLAGLFAGVSKYLIAWRGRHLVNPAAAGAVLVAWIGQGTTVWWVGTGVMLPAVLIGGLLVCRRIRRFADIWTYIGVAFLLTLTLYVSLGLSFWPALQTVLLSSPIFFLGLFMLSEPLTQAPRARQRMVIAAGVAVLAATPLLVPEVSNALGQFYISPELALVIGNVAAFLLGQRRGLPLTLTAHREVTPGVHEFTFDGPALRFQPGQYLELEVPHKADARGSRRMFSLANAPGRPTTVVTRVPGTSSSLKEALLALKPGAKLRATSVQGDFVLPRDPAEPLALVAGGIGITPFLSQLAAGVGGRDVRVVYAAAAARDLGYLDELAAAAPGVVVCPDRPALLPKGWDHVESPVLDAEVLRRCLPDLANRTVYVSGPPLMVTAVAADARTLGARRVRTDSFTGY